MKPRLILGLSLGAGALSQASCICECMRPGSSPLSSGKCHPRPLPEGWARHTDRGLTGRWGAGQAPVGPLPDHLEHADVEGPVERVGAGQLVNPELSGCDRLPCRDLGQVKAELLPVGLLVAQGAVKLHCKTKWAGVHSWLWARALGWQGPVGARGLGRLGRAFPPWGMGLTPGSACWVLRGPHEACSEMPTTAPGTRWVPTRAASISGHQALNPAGSAPCWLWLKTGPGEMDIRPKAKKGHGLGRDTTVYFRVCPCAWMVRGKE